MSDEPEWCLREIRRNHRLQPRAWTFKHPLGWWLSEERAGPSWGLTARTPPPRRFLFRTPPPPKTGRRALWEQLCKSLPQCGSHYLSGTGSCRTPLAWRGLGEVAGADRLTPSTPPSCRSLRPQSHLVHIGPVWFQSCHFLLLSLDTPNPCPSCTPSLSIQRVLHSGVPDSLMGLP